MFGMFMDLGIIWINSNLQVVDVRVAKKWRSLIVPATPAKYVLETRVEYAKNYEIGDQLQMG